VSDGWPSAGQSGYRRSISVKPVPEITFPLLDDPRRAVRVPSCVLFAVICAVLALSAGWALEPLFLRPYFFPASIAFVVTAVAAGTGYGILASAVFAAGHGFLHLPPHGSFAVQNPRELTAVVGFFLTGSLVSVIGGALRNAYNRLREHNRLLRAAQAQREDLLRALAHDIRSPLSVVTANASILARSVGEEDAASVRRRALMIERSATTIASMLGDLIEAATVESGHVRLERRPIDLATFAADLKERLAGSVATDRLRLAVPSGLPTMEVDPQRFERVLVNLLTNALKYSPVESPVTLGATLHDRTLIVSVVDEGPGIAAEDLPHIFDKYYRSSDARAQAGLGLGLFIARLLVEAHGGTIWAESGGAGGTTFKIALPTAASKKRSLHARGA
jgi:signal transduction histidine kinase